MVHVIRDDLPLANIAHMALTRSFTAGLVESTTTVNPAFLSSERSDSLALLLLAFWPLASDRLQCCDWETAI